jgi:hypothetical protein
MIISDYAFGRITVGDSTYTKDIIIFPDRIYSPWWRKEGHRLQVEDLSEVIRESPPLLIIGTGHSSSMLVPDSVISFLGSRKIDVIVENTRSAIDIYNKTVHDVPAAVALHLTC